MIDGITILQTFTETSYTWGWSWWLTIPILVIVMCGTLMVFVATSQKPNGTIIWICFICIVLSGIISLGMAKNQTALPIEYTYQVLLDENINMKEFAQRYEILEQQGITYIIKEKE